MKSDKKSIGNWVRIISWKKAIIVGFFIVIAGIFWWRLGSLVQSRNAAGATNHTITLTESGFEPTSTTVKLGDSVTFTSKRGKPFWPASDLHPSHELYPQFDPKRPIDPTVPGHSPSPDPVVFRFMIISLLDSRGLSW